MSDFQYVNGVQFPEQVATEKTLPPKIRRYSQAFKTRIIELADACDIPEDSFVRIWVNLNSESLGGVNMSEDLHPEDGATLAGNV